jgi:hypothetical protein
MQKRDRHHAVAVVGQRNRGGQLQYALSADEIGLEVGAEGVAAPGHAWNAKAGFAEQRIVDSHTEGRLGRQLGQDPATHNGKYLGHGKAVAREQTVGGRPVLELLPAGSQQAGHGATTQAEQAAQREGFGAFGDALLAEGGEAFRPEVLEAGQEAGRVFFRTGPGGWRRRRASRLLSSTDHSTVSPREKSMA